MIRILFVDDDVNVLNAMRRSMRAMRAEWDTHFAESGAAALDHLHRLRAEVDAVVVGACTVVADVVGS